MNDETRNPKSELGYLHELDQVDVPARYSTFVIRASFVIGYLVIRHF